MLDSADRQTTTTTTMSSSSTRELSTRLKIDRINERTVQTKLPKLEEFYRQRASVDEEIGKMLVNKSIFSNFPKAQESGAVALSTFLMNAGNRDELKHSGGLGAVIEMLRRVDIRHHAAQLGVTGTGPATGGGVGGASGTGASGSGVNHGNHEHVSNLIKSLHTLTEDDKQMQERLFAHPRGLSLINDLCFYCHGKDQLLAIEILKSLSGLKNGRTILLEHHTLDVIMSPELLHEKRVGVAVRRCAANLIFRLIDHSPKSLSVQRLIEITIDKDEVRQVDGYTEIQLLQAFLAHLEDLTRNNQRLPEVFTLFGHLIDEMKSSSFENLDHLQLILRCCLAVSKDQMQVDFMLKRGLGIAMQYLVRTDFLLFRKKTAVDSESLGDDKTVYAMKSRLVGMQRGKVHKKKAMDRTVGTLMALSLVMPEVHHEKSRNAEINIFTTESVLRMYTDMLAYKLDLVSELVSSGMIPALLIRVGRGHMINERYNKPVMSFLHSLMDKVMIAQPHRGEVMAMIQPGKPWGVYDYKERPYCRLGNLFINVPKIDPNRLPADLVYMLNHHVLSTQLRPNGLLDIRVISNTLSAQGITDLLFTNLRGVGSTIPSEVTDSVKCLSLLSFPVIAKDICDPLVLRKLLHMDSACFFPTLSLLCDIVPYCEEDEASIAAIVDNSGIKLLVKGLQVSGRVFPMKTMAYSCLAKLTKHPRFYDRLLYAQGISTVAGETRARRMNLRRMSRRERSDRDDEIRCQGIEILEAVLRGDIAAMTIQAMIRGFVCRAVQRKKALQRNMSSDSLRIDDNDDNDALPLDEASDEYW